MARQRTGPTTLQRWARGLRAGTGRVWSRLTADVAAHTLTYLGVVLSIAVVYVFYVYDYFGEFVDAQHRPLWFIGTVLFFLGIARTLRRGTSIPATATAVEMIGLLAIPMMLSGFFRDGCLPADHVWHPRCYVSVEHGVAWSRPSCGVFGSVEEQP